MVSTEHPPPIRVNAHVGFAMQSPAMDVGTAARPGRPASGSRPWKAVGMSSRGLGRWRWRAPVVAVLVVISLFAGACAAGLAWGRATLVDTDGYVDAMVRPLINDPAVKDALATELANRS